MVSGKERGAYGVEALAQDDVCPEKSALFKIHGFG